MPDLGHEFILGDDPAHITGKQAEDSKGPRSQGNVSPASREQLAALQIDVVAWKAQLPCEFTSIAQRRRLTSRWLFEARRVDFRTSLATPEREICQPAHVGSITSGWGQCQGWSRRGGICQWARREKVLPPRSIMEERYEDEREIDRVCARAAAGLPAGGILSVGCTRPGEGGNRQKLRTIPGHRTCCSA